MKSNVKIIKIEEDLVYLKFSNNTVRKYLKENFLSEPKVGQIVEILNNGLIVEKQMQNKQANNNISSVTLQKVAISVLIIYVFFLIMNMLKIIEVFSMDNPINIVISIYILITIILGTFYTYNISNKVLKTIFIILVSILIIMIFLYIIFVLFTIIWLYVACLSCLGG